MKIKECDITEPISSNKTNSIIDVAKKLKEHKIRHIVIVDEKESPEGIVASVDIVNNIIAEGKDYNGLKAEDIMIKPIFSVREDDDIEKAYTGMAKRNIFSCPVVSEAGKFIGMVTFAEAVKHLSKKAAQAR